MSLSRLRLTAGNVCLVLFFAFLFSGFWGGINSAYAMPAPPQVTAYGSTAEVVENQSTHKVDLTFQFVISSPQDFESVWADIYNGDDTAIAEGVYFNQQGVVQEAYSQVYGQVYAFTYSFGHSVYDPYIIVRSAYDNSMETVHFPEGEYEPPESGGGGGGGGGSSAPETVETEETDTGTVFTDPDGSVTVSLSTTKVEEQLAADPEMTAIAVELPQVEDGPTALQLPTGLVNSLANGGKELIVRSQGVDFTIPPAALQVPEVADQIAAGKDVQIRLSISNLPSEEAAAAFDGLTDEAREGKQFLGRVQQFEVAVMADGEEVSGISRFNRPLRLALAYDDADTAGVDEATLNVYQLVDGEAVFVGGKVDADNNLVIANLNHFSSYAIMAYAKNFADLANHWSKQDVDLMVSKYVVTGYPDETFRPDTNITRAEFAALLVRALGLDVVQPEAAAFTDVAAEEWYFEAVAAVKAAGLSSGYPDGTFKPNKTINRQEMAAMVANALTASGYQADLTEAEISAALKEFADGAEVAGWARYGAALAVSAGIVQGRGADNFAPEGLASRAESAVMLKRMMLLADYL